MKKRSLFFILGIILIGAVLRAPFTALPTVLGDIAQGLGVEVSSLGVLTSLPLLMFALFSSFATHLAQKIGLEHLFTYSLIVLTIGWEPYLSEQASLFSTCFFLVSFRQTIHKRLAS